MTEINWQEPPSDGRIGNNKGKHIEFAEQLRANPGRWAVMGEDLSCSTTTMINRGIILGFAPAGAFEAVTRGVVKNRGTIYVRYVGDRS